MTAVALLACAVLGCPSRPVENDLATYDLVSLFDLATVRRETGLIDLGTSAARAYLVEGWSWNESGDGEAGFVWGVGRRSAVRFFLAMPRDLPLLLRCTGLASPAGEPQTLGVSVNGVEVEELRLEPAVSEYRVTLPAAALAGGWNRLELRYGHWRSGPRIRQLAVKWDLIRFGAAVADPAVSLPRAAAAEATLVLPLGSRLEYYLRLPPGASLEIAELGPAAAMASRLEITLQPEGGDEATLAMLAPGRNLRVQLGEAAPGVARLSLGAVGVDPASSLELRRPRVVLGAGGAGLARPSRAVNVIVYLIDALRADRVGVYGGRRPTITPRIDEFAAQAVLFPEAVAQSSWTKPAVVSLFTGLLPPAHGVQLRRHALSPQATTLAETLRAAGYRTAAFSTNPFVSRSFGLDQGFLDFVYLDAGRAGTHHAFSDRVHDEILGWLDGTARQPFFLYVHTMDPHAPYTPPRADGTFGGGESPAAVPSCQPQQPLSEPARRPLMNRYDEEVAFNDASFGRLLGALRERGLYDDSLIVLLSDHGEAFWEHRGWQHENFLYSEVLDIPLILKPPGASTAAAVPGLAQQVDLLPTVLELIGLPVPEAVQGRSLLASGAPSSPRAGFAYLECPSGKRLEAVLAGPWKLIRTAAPGGATRRVELYHRRRDPGELTDLAGARPVVVRRLLDLLDGQRREQPLAPGRAVIGEELEETLRALGYVG